ncbi:MAG: acetate--CoA ligase family protein [Dehalococcoidia bacterium]
MDRAELAAVLTTLGALLHAHDEIAEIEVNPLIATADGLVAVDALVLLRR